MNAPTQFHQLPAPDSTVAGRNNKDASPSEKSFAQLAKHWKPSDTPFEQLVATISRFAHRLVDRTTGKAYSADELLAAMGSGEVTQEAIAAALGYTPATPIPAIPNAVFVCALTGSDDTGEIDYISSPYATLQAAMIAANARGGGISQFTFILMGAGEYYVTLPESVFNIQSVHLYAWQPSKTKIWLNVTTESGGPDLMIDTNCSWDVLMDGPSVPGGGPGGYLVFSGSGPSTCNLTGSLAPGYDTELEEEAGSPGQLTVRGAYMGTFVCGNLSAGFCDMSGCTGYDSFFNNGANAGAPS